MVGPRREEELQCGGLFISPGLSLTRDSSRSLLRWSDKTRQCGWAILIKYSIYASHPPPASQQKMPLPQQHCSVLCIGDVAISLRICLRLVQMNYTYLFKIFDHPLLCRNHFARVLEIQHCSARNADASQFRLCLSCSKTASCCVIGASLIF